MYKEKGEAYKGMLVIYAIFGVAVGIMMLIP
jgi:hypothetical protein